ncbi:hypothetical protein SEMRO_1235_G255030.1 [Seminavis robusta]|uniref:Uncharacterized protein n=1 Tax=Seminavis robusta TaxID=568900 RepID=A0A9N8HQ15_9STRA|nr:hypothetical protein SEMRO_1235_G255030.1 [Seminavis robusta]|eukprot:Sro1235_g255030.1 n/a (571) ;mRNA; f:21547-23352
MEESASQIDDFGDLPPEAIEAADELIAEYLASCDKKNSTPPAAFLKGDYQSPTGVMTSPMKCTRFSPAVVEHLFHAVGDNSLKMTDEKDQKKGDNSDQKRKLPAAKAAVKSPISKSSGSPPTKRSSVPQGAGYIQNGTASRVAARVKKPIPEDAVILSVDSDSDDEKPFSFQEDDRKPEAVKSGVKMEEKTVYYRNGNTLVAAGADYEDRYLEAIKEKSRAAVRESLKEYRMPPPPPPPGCSFLDAASHQTSGHTAPSATAASRISVQTAANANYPGAPPAMKTPSSANASRSTVRAATAKGCNTLKPAGRTRRMSKRPVQVYSSSSSSSESEESDDSIELTEEEQERFQKLGPYGRTVYLGEIKESRRAHQAGWKLKDKFKQYSKAPTYNGYKENQAPTNYLHAKKKEWKKKEAESKARKMVTDAKKKKKATKAMKATPRRSKSEGANRKVGDFPEYWTSDSMFMARANGTAGAAGIHSALLEGTQPDYRIPPLMLKAGERCSRRRLIQAMKVPALKLLVAMTKSTLAQDSTLLYYFVDVKASKKKDAPSPVENCVAAIIASLVDLYIE